MQTVANEPLSFGPVQVYLGAKSGKYPDGNKGKAIAAALRKVADELDV